MMRVQPLRLGERLVAKRRDLSELSSVQVFRGRPNLAHQRIPVAANDAQTATWTREDARLRVIRRDLNYRGWPEHPPREKGVDVALAIALVESAMLNEYDGSGRRAHPELDQTLDPDNVVIT